jgi:hypothetical protein
VVTTTGRAAAAGLTKPQPGATPHPTPTSGKRRNLGSMAQPQLRQAPDVGWQRAQPLCRSGAYVLLLPGLYKDHIPCFAMLSTSCFHPNWETNAYLLCIRGLFVFPARFYFYFLSALWL